MEQLSSNTVKRLSAQYGLTKARVRVVRERGVVGAAFVRDWLEMLTARAV